MLNRWMGLWVAKRGGPYIPLDARVDEALDSTGDMVWILDIACWTLGRWTLWTPRFASAVYDSLIN